MGNEGNLAWTKVQASAQAEPLSTQSRLQVGVRKEEEQQTFTFHTYRNLQIPHLWAVLVTGYNLRKENRRWGKQKTSFVNRAEISSARAWQTE